jgi:hypothetical protein
MFLTVIVIALCAAQAVVARTHLGALKSTAPTAKVGVTSSPEKNRHPDDVARDRRSKAFAGDVDLRGR